MATVLYSPPLESQIRRIAELLRGSYSISKRSLALLLLSEDEEIASLVADQEPEAIRAIQRLAAESRTQDGQHIAYSIVEAQRSAAEQTFEGVIRRRDAGRMSWRERLSRATINPLTGIPALLLILLGLYWFVGVLGAQFLVDWLESSVFESGLNPWVNQLVNTAVPWEWAQQLLAGDYGVFTLGIRYAVAIILPIVGTFFLAFAVIEDSGYLPRLALLIDRLFKRIGLNGRAVIPMVLGFGCDTMATIVTRTLETTRERVIATMLLALAIPCSAQLGVIFAILAGHPLALAVWGLTVALVFLAVGYLTARLAPGEPPRFYMELPPLRVPRISNVLVKTYSRMEWYFKEVLPLFVLASVAIWLGQITGAFDGVVAALEPAVRALGLPEQTAVAFLFGFFRRDYGAAGLYDVQGLMNGAQLAVAAVTLTLFVPCIAQFGVMLKERGWKIAVGMLAFIVPFAFFIGWALNQILGWIGAGL